MAPGVERLRELERALHDARAEERGAAGLREIEVDGRLVARLALGRGHRARRLEVRARLHAHEQRKGERQVEAFQRRRRREHEVRQARRLGRQDVDRDQEIEALEGSPQPSRVRQREQRVAAGAEKGAHLARARRQDLVGEHAAREGVVHGGEAADARALA